MNQNNTTKLPWRVVIAVAVLLIVTLLLVGIYRSASRSDRIARQDCKVSSEQPLTPIQTEDWLEYRSRTDQIEKMRAGVIGNLDELQNRSMAGGDLDRYQFVAECKRWLKDEMDAREDIREDFIRALRVKLQAENREIVS